MFENVVCSLYGYRQGVITVPEQVILFPLMFPFCLLSFCVFIEKLRRIQGINFYSILQFGFQLKYFQCIGNSSFIIISQLSFRNNLQVLGTLFCVKTEAGSCEASLLCKPNLSIIINYHLTLFKKVATFSGHNHLSCICYSLLFFKNVPYFICHL